MEIMPLGEVGRSGIFEDDVHDDDAGVAAAVDDGFEEFVEVAENVQNYKNY